MSSLPTIELSELLAPIVGDNPSGEWLLNASTYDAIREARRSDDPNLAQGDWKHELKVANWREVRKLASDALGNKSKDLQLAAWLSEALVRQHGFAGARDGFRLIGGLLEQFWPSLYPLPDDDGLEFRAQILELLNKTLPAAVSELKLTSSSADYSLNEWRESRQIEAKGPEEREALIKEGKITGEQWDKAVAGTGRAFYEELLSDLSESLQECDKLAAIVDQQFGQYAPSLLDLKRTLEDCQSLVDGIVKKKRVLVLEPDPVTPDAEPSDAGEQAQTAQVTMDGLESRQATHFANAENSRVVANVGSLKAASLEPRDRADALRRLEAIADFFRRNEPHSPVAYLVQRAVRWGQMPLEEWLKEVIHDQSVLVQLNETLGIKVPEQKD